MSKNTIYEQACNKVAGFQQMGDHFLRSLVIHGRAKSTHENYLRQIAKLALYYNRVPLNLKPVELEEYLYCLMQENTSASKSSFKHLVYGLRKLYLLNGIDQLSVNLPVMPRSNKLPVVLSQSEVKRLLCTPIHIWERLLYAMAYDTGMRISELVNVRISDVDLERRQIHIRESKSKNDRYVVISRHLVRGIHKHLKINTPKDYLFNNPDRKGIPICKTRIRLNLKESVKQAGIQKNISVHTFRHTFATHQLETGQNIITVKNALGHSMLDTTMMYLHIAKPSAKNATGCLDTLYSLTNEKPQQTRTS